MATIEIEKLVNDLLDGSISRDEAVSRLSELPFIDLGHTKLDTLRELRSGLPEIVYGRGKDPEHLKDIVAAALKVQGRVLVTKLGAEQLAALSAEFSELEIFPRSGTAVCFGKAVQTVIGSIGVVTAGTSDAACAEEALLSARFVGFAAEQISDVGIAGISRLLSELPRLRSFDVLLVIAGMEGALPGVVAGLVEAPVIAVPTSVGYGASFGGIAALLSMLVTCSPGVTVVNIDNGFGAAVAAAKIVRHIRR